MDTTDKHLAHLRNNRGLTARQLDRRSEQARNQNNGEQKLLELTLGKLECKEKKSVKLLRRTTQDLKKTLHELNMAGNSVKVWMELEERARQGAHAMDGQCHRTPFASVDENGGKKNGTSLSEYSRHRLPRISTATAGSRAKKTLAEKGAGARRYSENDIALASKLLQLKLNKGDSVVEEATSETDSEENGDGTTSSPKSTYSPKLSGERTAGKHAWMGNVYKTESPRDSPYGSPKDSPRDSPKTLPRCPGNLHKSASIESLGMRSLSSFSEISIDVTTSPSSPDEQRKNSCSPSPPKSQMPLLASKSTDDIRPDTPSPHPFQPPLSPRIPIPNIKVTQSRMMQPVRELADIDPLVPTSPSIVSNASGWPSPNSLSTEWRAEKPLRDARRKMLLNLPATFAVLSRRRHSSPESQDEAVKLCQKRFSEMLDKRRTSEQSELQAKVKEFLDKTISASSLASSSDSNIEG
ncbi:uncharacterized protein [Asterias amurensis]|uniref:uncharacterized protein n=1 Tax=Asterias amurensis TaxID=7602 RepID=UPI003AB3DEA6